jgi:hypothetical protein
MPMLVTPESNRQNRPDQPVPPLVLAPPRRYPAAGMDCAKLEIVSSIWLEYGRR